MNKRFLLCSAVAALMLPGITRAQESQPAAPDRPDRPNWEQLREEMRNLPPEERQARIRELRERSAQRPGQPAPDRPNWEKLREEMRNLSPEERQARIAEFRERWGQPGLRPESGRPNMQRPLAAGMAGSELGRLMRVLTPEQRQSLRSASEANQDKVRELEEKLAEAQKAAMEASIARKIDEAALRSKLQAAAELNTELALLRARTLAKMEPPLTDDQIEQIKNPPPPGERLRDRPPGAFQQRPPREPLQPEGRPLRRAPAAGDDLPPRR